MQTQTQISAAVEFVVSYSNGREERYSTYPEAIEALREAGCAEIGHSGDSGDLEDGGDRTRRTMTGRVLSRGSPVATER